MKKISQKTTLYVCMYVCMCLFPKTYFAQGVYWPESEDEDAIFIEYANDYNCHYYAWLYHDYRYFNYNHTGPFFFTEPELGELIVDAIEDNKIIPSLHFEQETDIILVYYRQYDEEHDIYVNVKYHSMIRSRVGYPNDFPTWVESTNNYLPLFRHKLNRWYDENMIENKILEIEPFTTDFIEGYWSVYYVKPKIYGENEIFKYTAREQEAAYITNANYTWTSSSNIDIVSMDYNKVMVKGNKYGKGWIRFEVESYTGDIIRKTKYLKIVAEPALFSMSVSPNPAPESMIVNIEKAHGNNQDIENTEFDVRLFDMYNSPVLQDEFTGSQAVINSSALQNGVYVVKVQNREEQIHLTKTVVIQK